MSHAKNSVGMAAMAALLAACGGSNSETSSVATSTARGTLIQNPPYRVASLNASALNAQLSASTSGQQLLQLAGAPACGVDVYDFQYYTVGGQGETATASGALMVPTGAAPQCSGPRPVVLYAHGTQANQAANLANITDPSNTEGDLILATFAAQGYIVVAPNYAGYDISSLKYHPFLDGDQQSKDMIDALAAARTALPNTFAAATSDSGKLFVTGYSQGGYVAMATQRALQSAGQAVTAAAPMSGPYALEAFGDAIITGHVNIGSTIFVPMIVTSYQQAYGNIFSTLTDVYDQSYAANPAFSATSGNVLPSTTPIATLYQTGVLPQTALFSVNTPGVNGAPSSGSPALDAALAVPNPATNPTATADQLALWSVGFGSPGLITNTLRISYAADMAGNPDGAFPTPAAGLGVSAHVPTSTLRAGLRTNDLRNPAWAPAEPTLLCGGDQDPTVFFQLNTQVMQSFWSGLPAGALTVVDVDPTLGTNSNPSIAELQGAFQQTLAGIAGAAVSAGATDGGQSAVVQAYHTTVAPFCAVVARTFFGNF